MDDSSLFLNQLCLFREENEDVVADILENHPGWSTCSVLPRLASLRKGMERVLFLVDNQLVFIMTQLVHEGIGQNCQKWLVKNGWSKMVGQKWSKLSLLVVKNGQNCHYWGQKWSKFVITNNTGGQKWSNCHRWSQMVKNQNPF